MLTCEMHATHAAPQSICGGVRGLALDLTCLRTKNGQGEMSFDHFDYRPEKKKSDVKHEVKASGPF